MFNLFSFRQGNNNYSIELDAKESINSLLTVLELIISKGIYEDISIIDFSVSAEDFANDLVLYSCLSSLFTNEKLFENYSKLNTESKQYLYLKNILKDIKKTVVESKEEIDIYEDIYIEDSDTELEIPELAFPEKYDTYFNFVHDVLSHLTLNIHAKLLFNDVTKIVSNFEYVNSRLRIDLLHANYFNVEEFTGYSEIILNKLDLISDKLLDISFNNLESYLNTYVITFELVLILNNNSLNFFKKENAVIFIEKLDKLFNSL